MSLAGHLSEFSLPEIFQLLEQGNKTGRLSIQERSDNPSYKGKIFRIWFRQGTIVAAADRTDGYGLLSIIQQRSWLTSHAAVRVVEVCGLDQPIGLCLKAQGVLEAEHLKLLFSQQVLQQVCKLFELRDGYFQFDNKAALQNTEVTGLSALPKDVTLASLRALRDWTVLSNKLPEPTSGLISAIPGKPQLRLSQLEWQVWEFTNGKISIQEIAKHLQLPTEKVQQVVFRLMVVGLAEELPLVEELPLQTADLELPTAETAQTAKMVALPQAPISQSFLTNLVGFLKGKA